MKDQLGKLLNYLGLTATRFADAIGVQRSGISHILSGRNQPSYEFLVKIARQYPEISLEWLILGQGPMLKEQKGSQTEPLLPFRENPEDIGNKPGITEKTHAILMEEQALNHAKQVTNVNFVQQVLLIYSNGTFKSLQPAGED
jgi:transcriptional regulator with XRE-family HTH domain